MLETKGSTERWSAVGTHGERRRKMGATRGSEHSWNLGNSKSLSSVRVYIRV